MTGYLCFDTLRLCHSEEEAERDGGRGLDAVPHSVEALDTPGPARPQPPPHPKRLFVAGDGLPHLSTALVGEPLTTRVMLCCTRKAETGCGALWCR